MIIPKHVQYKWNLLQSAGLKLYLCGGAVRDSILNRTIKDWDFYVHSTRTEFEDIAKRLGIWLVSKSDPSLEQYKSNRTLSWVYEDAGADIQYMLLDSPFNEAVVSQFGCSISKCWYDGKMIYLHPDFVTSLQTGVIYYNDTYRVRDKYLNKIKSYFPKHVFKPYREMK